MTEIDSFLSELLKNIGEAKTYDKYYGVISSCAEKYPEMQMKAPNLYKIGDKYIRLTTRSEEDRAKRILPMLTKEGVTISPVYLGSAVSKEGFAAIIFQVPGASTGDLYSFDEGYCLLSQEAKKQAYRDIEIIVNDMGFFNPNFINPQGLFITPDSANYRVFVMDWSENMFFPVFLYCNSKEIGSPDFHKDYQDITEEIMDNAQRLFFRGGEL